MVAPRTRVAVLGGDGRFPCESLPGCRVRLFPARRYAGNGPLRSLERSLQAGGVDRVVVLARWNGHSATTAIMRLCRKLGVPFEVIP